MAGPPGITSLGRNAAFSPVAGSYGFVSIQANGFYNGNGVYINVAKWSPSRQINALSVTNFSSPVDGNNTVHEESIAGIMTTSFTITGVRDAGNIGYHPTPGDIGTAILGYDANHTFTINFLVLSDGGEQSVEGVAGFEFNIKALGLALMAGRTGAA